MITVNLLASTKNEHKNAMQGTPQKNAPVRLEKQRDWSNSSATQRIEEPSSLPLVAVLVDGAQAEFRVALWGDMPAVGDIQQ